MIFILQEKNNLYNNKIITINYLNVVLCSYLFLGLVRYNVILSDSNTKLEYFINGLCDDITIYHNINNSCMVDEFYVSSGIRVINKNLFYIL